MAAGRGRARRGVLAGRADGRRPAARRRDPAAEPDRRRPTIGLRVPDHDAPRALAAAVGPIPTTSANRSGAPEAADAASIVDQLGHAVAVVLDGGPAHGGPPSTVVDCTTDPPRILRQGAIARADVERVLGRPVAPDEP